MNTHHLLVALAPLTLLAPAMAQTKYVVTPAGHEFWTGTTGNTFPLGRTSASYQQIHDAIDMGALNGGRPMVLSGMDFRPGRSWSMTARTFEVQITLSVTKVTSAQMSTTFSSNLGAKSTVVLPYTKMNLPSGAGNNSNPNAPLWKFPYKTIFIYSAVAGNLCWDWRQRNSTSSTNTFFDYVNGTVQTPITRSVGTGCKATGRTTPATANIATAGSNLVLGLSNARANSSAFLAFGVTRAPTPLWCGTLYVTPAIVVGGATNAAGTWTAGTFPASVLNGSPYRELFMQYAFADAGLASGIGLSNYAVAGSPPNGNKFVSRLWNVSAGNGAETATTGSLGRNSGLITMFTIR